MERHQILLVAALAFAPGLGPALAQEDLLPLSIEETAPPADQDAAQSEPAEPESSWSASLGVSYLATTGNSESESFGLDLTAERRPRPWGFELVGSFHRSEEQGTATAERALAGLRGKRAAAERWELFGGASAQRDVFADIDLRVILEAGAVYKALLGPRHQLDLDLGATWTDENRIAPEPDRESLGAIVGLEYEWRISATAKLSQRLVYHPNFDRSADWRAVSLSALTAAINRRFSLKIGYEHHYRSEPIGDNDELDTVARASLVWNL